MTKKQHIFGKEMQKLSKEEKVDYILERLPDLDEYIIDQIYEFILDNEDQ